LKSFHSKIQNTKIVTLKLLLTIFTLVMFSCTSPSDNKEIKETNEKPNVILILADDMGWSDLGCYGSEVATPNLDAMANQGIRFTQMYNTAKCMPSRACLLTGLYSQQTGYNTGYKKPMSNAVTLGEIFKMAGYTTMWAGKHHSTELPTTRGFDHYSGLFEGASNHFNPGKKREGEGQPAQKRPDRPWVIDGEVFQPYTPPSDFYTTDAFTDYALGWLEQHKTDTDPFFLYMAYTAPHDPLMAWPEDIAKYRGKYLAGYEATRKARFAKQKEIGLLTDNYPISSPIYDKWDDLSDIQKDEEDLKMAVYSAMVDRLDQNIGRLQAKLREMEVDENTLILFMSDNGASAEVVNLEGSGEIGSLTRWTSLGGDWANVSNVPLQYYKNYSHEGGIKTPMIAYWPQGIQERNTFNESPLHLIDLLPTLAELIGVEYPSNFNDEVITPVDGISFLPIFSGKEISRKEPLYWEWQHGKAIREGDWKLVSYKDKWTLHNLKDDPVEAIDLSTSEPEKMSDLKAKYDDWANKFVSSN
jgi:arylsulfatase